jgi:hypothetical protein
MTTRLAVLVRLADRESRVGRNSLWARRLRYDRSSGGYSTVTWCSDILSNLFRHRRAGGVPANCKAFSRA